MCIRDRIRREQRSPGTRGMIYDRNGQLLAYNELSYNITMSDNGYYDSRSQRNAVSYTHLDVYKRQLLKG